jgi:hypothetical protein
VTLPSKNPLQQPSFPYTVNYGRPAQSFAQYMAKLDALVEALAAGNAPNNLVNAANDAAAAAAGVGINKFYRNGSVIHVRVV